VIKKACQLPEKLTMKKGPPGRENNLKVQDDGASLVAINADFAKLG